MQSFNRNKCLNQPATLDGDRIVADPVVTVRLVGVRAAGCWLRRRCERSNVDVWYHVDGASGANLEKLDARRRRYRWVYEAHHDRFSAAFQRARTLRRFRGVAETHEATNRAAPRSRDSGGGSLICTKGSEPYGFGIDIQVAHGPARARRPRGGKGDLPMTRRVPARRWRAACWRRRPLARPSEGSRPAGQAQPRPVTSIWGCGSPQSQRGQQAAFQ